MASNPESPWPTAAGDVLLPLARAAIADELGLPAQDPSTAAWLHEPGASFVTLHTDGRLRGCIGTLSAYRPLLADVRDNAVNAAFRDPRFGAVTTAEFAGLDLEVSLLTPPEPISCVDETELIEQLNPGTDGVLLEVGERRGTFLPQVWEHLPDPADFVAELKVKAGVGGRPWDPEWRVSRYTVTAWREP